ncbi:transposase [Comamonas squillarum]
MHAPIQFCPCIKNLFKLPFRQIKGFFESLLASWLL